MPNIETRFTFKRLSAETLNDFVTLHETVDLSHAPDWRGCFCQFYYMSDAEGDWEAMTCAQKKDALIHRVQTQQMDGYLAYVDHQPVGWASIDDWARYGRINAELDLSDLRTAAVVCFLIDAAYRGQRLREALIRFASEDLKGRGVQRIIGLPTKGRTTEASYHGSENTFIRLGFERTRETDDWWVYEKLL